MMESIKISLEDFDRAPDGGWAIWDTSPSGLKRQIQRSLEFRTERYAPMPIIMYLESFKRLRMTP